MELLDDRSKRRAEQSFRCLPFNSNFYNEIIGKGVNAKTVFEEHCKYFDRSIWLLHSGSIEADFAWLIKVGILRREVDGQGLTSRVRLTPMGRQIIEEYPSLPDQNAGLFEYIIYFFKRNLFF